VVEATADYREDEDELGEFITRMCWNEGEVERGTLYRAFITWAEERGNRYQPKQTTFSKRIAERPGIKSRKSGAERYWTGISLRTREEQERAPGNTICESFVPREPGDSRPATFLRLHPSNNARFGHLGPENSSFPQSG
jgi:phage/plasmid-associated DNA primase